MKSHEIQTILAEYTDAWINQQHPSERTALRVERASLEADLAEALAREGRRVPA